MVPHLTTALAGPLQELEQRFLDRMPDIERSENHTRNTFYLHNIETLQGILRQAGMRVRLGSPNPELASPVTIDLPGGPTAGLPRSRSSS